MAIYAIPSNKVLVTSKPLKKSAPSESYLKRKKFFDTHDFSLYRDPDTGEYKFTAKPKNECY